MLHVDSGDVGNTVAWFGGFLGMGNEPGAVDWEALTVEPVERQIVFDVDRVRLEAAPDLAKDAWSTTAEAAWVADLNRHCGSTFAPRVMIPRDPPKEALHERRHALARLPVGASRGG